MYHQNLHLAGFTCRQIFQFYNSLDVQTEKNAPYKHHNRNKEAQTETSFRGVEYSFSQTGQK